MTDGTLAGVQASLLDLMYTPSERRTLLRLLDLEWGRVNREREQDTHLNETALVYLQDLESLQRKLNP